MHTLCMEKYFSADSQPFALYVSDPERNNCEHSHDFDELVFVESGHGLHVLNGQPGFVQQGDVFFVHGQESHFYDRLGTLRLTNLLINTRRPLRYLSNLQPLLNGINRPPDQQPGWLTPQERLACRQTIARLTAPSSDALLDDAAREVVWLELLLSLHRSLSSASRGHTHFKAHRLIHWLQANCFEEIDWDTLCSHFLLSKRTLYRQVKEITGLSPHQFIRKQRLLAARVWLRSGEASITDIAFRCGFSSSNHFSSSYKNLFGYAPSQEPLQP